MVLEMNCELGWGILCSLDGMEGIERNDERDLSELESW